jgi:hypothetical protein
MPGSATSKNAMTNKLEVDLGTGLVATVEVTGDELADLNARQAGETDRAWAEVRDERDRLLAETDWWAVSDRTMTAEQITYRQELRDLPANTADPLNVTWPTKP